MKIGGESGSQVVHLAFSVPAADPLKLSPPLQVCQKEASVMQMTLKASVSVQQADSIKIL